MIPGILSSLISVPSLPTSDDNIERDEKSTAKKRAKTLIACNRCRNRKLLCVIETGATSCNSCLTRGEECVRTPRQGNTSRMITPSSDSVGTRNSSQAPLGSFGNNTSNSNSVPFPTQTTSVIHTLTGLIPEFSAPLQLSEEALQALQALLAKSSTTPNYPGPFESLKLQQTPVRSRHNSENSARSFSLPPPGVTPSHMLDKDYDPDIYNFSGGHSRDRSRTSSFSSQQLGSNRRVKRPKVDDVVEDSPIKRSIRPGSQKKVGENGSSNKYGHSSRRRSFRSPSPRIDTGISYSESISTYSGDHIPSNLFIKINRVDKDAIAMGGFASIHIGRFEGSKVAVKAVRMSQQNERVARRRLSREIIVWKQLSHPNITPLLGVAKCPTLSRLETIVTPWYDNGSAAAYLSSSILNFEERLRLSLGVAEGIHYLHNLSPVVIHGDLKPSNVLIDQQGIPKICDFGLARMINEEARSGLTTSTRHNTTPLYAAPEILLANGDAPPFEPTTASDVYSLGSLLYEFLTGQMPYANLSNNLHIIVAVVKGAKPATRPVEIASFTRLQWDLFESCWMERSMTLRLCQPGRAEPRV